MVTNYIRMKMCETYDLNTTVGKITVLGVRTPSRAVASKYLNFGNWRKCKFNSCNIRLGCASQLPVDPLGVGFESGQIAPQDVINPMLFKTVTGESFDRILNVIYSSETVGDSDNQIGGSLRELKLTHLGTGENSALEKYYALLADSGWRQAHPQQGIIATGIVPLVHDIHITRPLAIGDMLNRPFGRMSETGNMALGSGSPKLSVGENGLSLDGTLIQDSIQVVTGATRPMPSFECNPMNNTVNTPVWPSQYCACLIMPPATMHSLYYRLIIEWDVTFSEFVPNFRNYVTPESDDVYYNWQEVPVSTATASAMAMMESRTDMVDSIGTDNLVPVTSSVL